MHPCRSAIQQNITLNYFICSRRQGVTSCYSNNRLSEIPLDTGFLFIYCFAGNSDKGEDFKKSGAEKCHSFFACLNQD